MPSLLFVNRYYLILLFELNRLLKKAKYKLIFHPKAIGINYAVLEPLGL